MKPNAKSSVLSCLFSTAFLTAILLCGASGALAQQRHALIAQYTFDQNGYPSADSSGHNNQINGGSGWGGTYQVQFSTNAVAGGGAALFDGGESLAEYSPPPDQTFDNWLAMYYGSFSVSLWINTTNVVGNDSDDLNGNNGAVIVWAYDDHDFGYSGTIPVALTGRKVAFYTSDAFGDEDTLHSTNNVTTGHYVHIVVTRDQSTGQKSIYVNGALDSTDTASTNNLDGNDYYLDIGGVLGAGYAGLLDDVQFYAGVLDGKEVAFLYKHPGTPVPNFTGASSDLAACYDFDEGTDRAADLTANGNNLIYDGHFGGPVLSSDSISGNGAVYFNGAGFLTPSTNLLSTLAGNFSLSVWVKSTQDIAWDTAPAFYGAGIVSADVPGLAKDLIPVALTGGTIGFNTGSDSADDTINSTTDINDGDYHHVVVTRNQATGEKQIYIDGELSSSDSASTGLLDDPKLITIGALADASQSDPTSPQYYGYQGYVGLLDDIQIYSRVVSASDVSYLYNNPGQTLSIPVDTFGGLVCHYDFDEGSVLAKDVSGNNNDIVYAGSMYFNTAGQAVTNDAESGPGALSFDGTSYLVPEGNNLVAALAGNFSLSVWLQTTQTFGSEGEAAYDGAGIVTAEVPGQVFDLIPLALTGGNIAFETDGSYQDVLTAPSSINDGNYHHVVVTRNQITGEKQIFIDGVLNTADTDDASYLNAPQLLILGAQADASQGSPNSPSQTASNGYAGLMDNLQIYSRVLTGTEVAYLFDNPGATLPVTPVNGLGQALGARDLPWSTFADAPWFVESTNTYSINAEAAQSGSLLEGQSSVLQTIVTGPGTLTFYWETTAADGDDFDLEFDLDGIYQGDINGQTSWTQQTITINDSNTHLLTWNANTLNVSNGSLPTDAGFVDQVCFAANPTPPTLSNPTVTGTNFQFFFQSLANHISYVEYSTNLSEGNWLPYRTLLGDGSWKTINVTTGTPAAEFFRVRTK